MAGPRRRRGTEEADRCRARFSPACGDAVKYLVDTDWVIDYLNQRSPAHDELPSLFPHGVAISIITFTEIYEGIYSSRDPERAEQVFLDFLRSCRVLALTRAVAKRHARIRGELRQRKRPVTHRALDLLIAATALARELTLVTNNLRDYTDIPALRLYPSGASQAGPSTPE